MWKRGKNERERGAPPSGNGASSFHLFWQLPDGEAAFRECSVDFKLLTQPQHDRLVFWALQASFGDGLVSTGGAHFGFQWHPDYTDRRAVCWGGYAAAGGELSGDRPFFANQGNDNVCAYPWTIGQRWTWRIAPTPARPGWWRAELVSPDGVVAPIRDLNGGGDRLSDLMVWSEVFARCDDPSTTVRWSNPTATTLDGRVVQPRAMTVNYQAYRDGGCTNTDSRLDGDGIVQVTNCARVTPQGAVLRLS